jgi:hypothetical protein
MSVRFCAFVTAFVSIALLSAGHLRADGDDWWRTLPIKAVRVVVHTEDDDKDSEESVTLRVSYGPFSAEHVEPAGEKWADQTDKVFDVGLSTPHPPASATYELHVSKSRAGSPTGKGWKASFEMVALPDSGGQMQLFIDGDRNRPRSSTFTMGDGEQNPNDVVVMPNAKVVSLGLRTASRTRPVVRFNRPADPATRAAQR